MVSTIQVIVKKQQGFTIVELLIVVVVIAILAAITIVAYNGISQRAKAAAAQTAVQQAVKKVTTYNIENGDVYPLDLAGLGLANTESTTYQYSVNTSTTPQGYCITAATGGVAYYTGYNYTYTGSSSGTINQPTPTEGTCPGHNAAGNSVVNLVTNPSAEVAQTGYGRPGSSALTLSTAQAQQGTQSAIVTMPASMSAGTTGMSFLDEDPFIYVKPNTSYVASAYVYVPAATGAIRLAIQGAGVGTSSNGAAEANSGSTKDQWIRLHNTFTTDGDDGVMFYLLNNSATGGSTTQFWADSFMVTEGTTLRNYADGNSSGWVWNGTAGLSRSTGPAL